MVEEQKTAPNEATGRPAVKPLPRERHIPQLNRADRNVVKRNFLVRMTLLCLLGFFFCGGQGLRYWFRAEQMSALDEQLQAEYVTVLGDRLSESPFGRLQFEHGKLSAERKIGLAPLTLLATLSRNAPMELMIEELGANELLGHVSGFFGPDTSGFDAFISDLNDDETFQFRVERTEDVLSGMDFRLLVGLR